MNQHEAKLKFDREKGEYYEEVTCFVDNIIERVEEGDITCGKQVDDEITNFLRYSTSYNKDEYLCFLVLIHSKHPTAYFAEFGFDRVKEGVDPGGKKDFPFGKFAEEAMERDIRDALEKSPHVMGLPAKEEEEEDDEEEDDEEEEEPMLVIDYRCPNCQHEWQEQYTSACDSTCSKCDTRNITALHWRRVEEDDND